MALKLNFYSPEHGVNYPEAYARLIEGKFTTNTLQVLIGVYAAEAAREKEKALAALSDHVQKAEEEILIRQSKHFAAAEAANTKFIELRDIKKQFDEGRVKETAVKKAQDAFDAADKIEKETLKAVETARTINEQVRSGIQNEIPVKPVAVRQFTFNVTPEMWADNPLHSLAYNLVKDVPEFQEAVDA